MIISKNYPAFKIGVLNGNNVIHFINLFRKENFFICSLKEYYPMEIYTSLLYLVFPNLLSNIASKILLIK